VSGRVTAIGDAMPRLNYALDCVQMRFTWEQGHGYFIQCQDLQAEQLNMRVVDCIDDSYFSMEMGPAHRLIP
jgi:hypothetical protein